jgi:outer membrane protein assembly factor BamB
MPRPTESAAPAEPLEIVRELGPVPGAPHVAGVTFDGHQLWVAVKNRLTALDPDSGSVVRTLEIAADAGTAFDGKHLWQLVGGRVHKLDPETGRVLASFTPAIDGALSGMAWAEGTLWVGNYTGGKLHQIDAETGAVLRTLASDRFVTGVSWVEGALWHGTVEGPDGAPSELRRVDPSTGAVEERLAFPSGVGVSGLEGAGGGLFFCGGGNSAKVRVVRRRRRSA